jgi:hypothetical protein
MKKGSLREIFRLSIKLWISVCCGGVLAGQMYCQQMCAKGQRKERWFLVSSPMAPHIMHE